MSGSANEGQLESFLSKAPPHLKQSIESNLALRMLFPTETDKFYPTEQAINTLLADFDRMLEETQLPPQQILESIISSKILVDLLRTLEHPNTDINISAINVLHSLIIDLNEEINQAEQELEQAFPLYFRTSVWMIENDLVQSLVRSWGNIQEDNIDEYEGCRRILKLLLHLLELSDTVFPILVLETKAIQLLANRVLPNFTVSHRSLDDNKFIASDLLLALLQTPAVAIDGDQNSGSVSAVRQFYSLCGIEVLIQTMSYYEGQLPTEVDEREFLSNLFSCLNVILVSIRESNRQLFKMKGCYLMVSYICSKSEFGQSALKALSNSMNLEESPEVAEGVCEEIVEDSSLKYLFPILMGQGLKGKDSSEQLEINQHILKILYFLVLNSSGVPHHRIVYKLTENRFAKLERVFELRIEHAIDDEKNKVIKMKPSEYIEMIEQENLGMVEICDKLIMLLFLENAKIKNKIITLMRIYGVTPQSIRNTISRQYMFIDEGQQKRLIGKIIANQIRELQEWAGKPTLK